MSVSRYCCVVIGEDSAKASRLRPSTQRRIKAFAIAIHIPVALWALTGFVIASRVFNMPLEIGILIALASAALIYLVERVVLATPKSKRINAVRFVMGIAIALIGASAADLALFEREIEAQLHNKEEMRIQAQYEKRIDSIKAAVMQKKRDADSARKAANCEADGTCGSRTKNIGPVYRALDEQAKMLWQEYLEEKKKLESTEREYENERVHARRSHEPIENAGLLARIEALHSFIWDNLTAALSWSVLFLLVVLFEMMVVIAKWSFPDTIDDQLEAFSDQIARHKAERFCKMLTSPFAEARELLEETTC